MSIKKLKPVISTSNVLFTEEMKAKFQKILDEKRRENQKGLDKKKN